MIAEKPDAREPEDIKGEITFEKVAFAYKADSPVLKEIDFKIEPGQLVGFVGATGGGKSTVASLIPRFYDTTSGRVLIDGIDVRDFKIKALRNQIGCVLQDTVLFARHDRREHRATGGRARRARRSSLPRSSPTRTSSSPGCRRATTARWANVERRSRAASASGIGIARAIIRNSPILILDEPTAALDTESEKIVMDALERLMKGRTAIAIAHRLSTITRRRQDRRVQGRVRSRAGHARRAAPR